MSNVSLVITAGSIGKAVARRVNGRESPGREHVVAAIPTGAVRRNQKV